MPSLHSTREAAAFLGISENGVRTRARARGVIPIRGKAGALRWTDDAISKLDNRERQAAIDRQAEESRINRSISDGLPLAEEIGDYPIIEARDTLGELRHLRIESHDRSELDRAIAFLRNLGLVVERVVELARAEPEVREQKGASDAAAVEL